MARSTGKKRQKSAILPIPPSPAWIRRRAPRAQAKNVKSFAGRPSQETLGRTLDDAVQPIEATARISTRQDIRFGAAHRPRF